MFRRRLAHAKVGEAIDHGPILDMFEAISAPLNIPKPCLGSSYGSFRKIGVPYFGVLTKKDPTM